MDDARALATQKAINDRITREHPTWSRFTVEHQIEQIMAEYPGWEYRVLEGIGFVPQIALTQYRG